MRRSPILSISRGPAGLLADPAAGDALRDPRRAAGERCRRLPLEPLAAGLPSLRRRHRGRRGQLQRVDGADYRGRRSRVAASPISIDPEEFDELAESPAVLEAEREIVEWRPERLIVRVDRTDRPRTSFEAFAPSSSTSTHIPRCTSG